tara:strand:+ start:1389 stop:1937 length:549 start_codon:yes stop_codon:yes gene_type:complete
MKILNFLRLKIRFLKYFLKALINNFYQKKKISSNPPDVLVISTGGVATTTLIKYIKLFSNVNCENDSDGLKHLIQPPEVDFKKTKIIYITGSDEKIFNSLKRRNIFNEQMMKLGCPLSFFFTGRLEKYFFSKCIKRQKKNFYNNDKILTLMFDEIWDKKESIKNYLDIDSKLFLEEFPSKKI